MTTLTESRATKRFLVGQRCPVNCPHSRALLGTTVRPSPADSFVGLLVVHASLVRAKHTANEKIVDSFRSSETLHFGKA